MDIEYNGGNCLEIITKKSHLVIDPKLSIIGRKDITVKDAIILATQLEFSIISDEVVIDSPGEYEVKNLSIVGVAARRLIDHDQAVRATMYRVVVDGIAFAIIGHVATPLKEAQLEALGVIDIAVVPVGGNGYTLDAHQAVSIIRQLDPKVVIPTHYADNSAHYEVPQSELEPFIRELAAVHETLPKLRIKNGVLPEILTVIELTPGM